MNKKVVAILLALAGPALVYASMQVFTGDNTQLGILSQIKCGLGVGCTVVNGKLLVKAAPSAQTSTSSTTTTATLAQCGNTFKVTSGNVITLPEASTVIGCRYTFINMGTSINLDVNPADAVDKILILTNAAGDAIRSSTLGESITLEAISDNQWAAVGKEQGTWSDVN